MKRPKKQKSKNFDSKTSSRFIKQKKNKKPKYKNNYE